MKRLTWCGVFLVIATLTAAAQQAPVTRPGVGTPPAPSPIASATASPTAPASGTGRIRGRVVRADTGAPLRGAQVLLSGDIQFARRAIADDDGRYEFTEVPAGRYSLQADLVGYLMVSHGQRRPGEPGQQIALADAQALNQIDFALPRGGVITGRVTDESGEPVTGAQIRIERYQYGPGGRQLVTFPLGIGQTGFPGTNDLGEFRVFGLAPGEYVVSARFQSREVTPGAGGVRDAAETFQPTYFPGTERVAEARTVRVGASQEVAAPFALVPGKMVRLSGTVTTSNGSPAAGFNVRLATQTATTSGEADGGFVAADGSFAIGNVAPGDYVLRVRPQPAGPGAEVASLPITVTTEDISGIRLTTTPGTRIAGRLEWEGSAPRPTATLRVNTASAQWPRRGPTGEFTFTYLDPEAGTVREDDTFGLDGTVGLVSFRVLGLALPWTVKAVIGADGKDILDTGADAATLGGDTRVRVILTDRITEVSGSVRDSRGQAVTHYVAVVLPEQEMEGGSGIRFTRAVRSDQQGVFRFRTLPQGRYVAVAVDALEQGGEWDPAFQKRVRASGESFTLTDERSQTLTLGMLR